VKRRMPRIVIFGDNCLNVVLRLPLALRRGANADITDSLRRPGGNALVTSMALARWGVDVAYAGVVGVDEPGSQLIDWMGQVGLKTDLVLRRGRTRVSYAIVDNEDRTILDERADAGQLSLRDWGCTEMAAAVRDSDLVMVDRYSAAVHEQVASQVQKRGDLGHRPVLAYRTGSRSSGGFSVEDTIMPHVDITLTKKAFLQDAVHDEDPESGCRHLAAMFGTGAVVATLGAGGAAFYDRSVNKTGTVRALNLHCPMTTLGGGDFFRAGFLLGLLRGNAIEAAVRSGNVAAGLHCSRQETDDIQTLFYGFEDLDCALRMDIP
jgi:sugar/nucleoside kinase (ribokinase family)